MRRGSKLLNENIFESMRLVLPEHRDLMGRSEMMPVAKAEPAEKFDEYRYVGMMEILQEAIENGLEILVTLNSGKYQPAQVMVGQPQVRGERLFVNGQRVPMEKIIDVKRA